MLYFDVFTFTADADAISQMDAQQLAGYLQELQETLVAALAAQQSISHSSYTVRQSNQAAGQIMDQVVSQLADSILAINAEITNVKIALGHDDVTTGY